MYPYVQFSNCYDKGVVNLQSYYWKHTIGPGPKIKERANLHSVRIQRLAVPGAVEHKCVILNTKTQKAPEFIIDVNNNFLKESKSSYLYEGK